MPAIRNIPLSLKTGEILRREGFRRHSKIKPEIKSVLLEQLAYVKSAHLLEPAIAYEIYPITDISNRQLSSGDDTALSISSLLSLLPDAQELAAVVGTIGPKLEKQVTEYNNRGEPLRGLLLDGVGSAAVDSLTQLACKFIEGEVSARGYQVSSPISPGMPGLPITAQQQLLEMASAREIEVNLTSSGMMIPRKSASMVIGIGPQMPMWTRAEVCARCNLNKTCPYRIQGSAEKEHEVRTGN